MVTQIITAPKGAKYIDKIKELGGYLPENCIFDKGETGCGATTLAIDNDRSTIIAVPSVNLIHNKMKQKDHLFGVWGDISNGEIESYLNNTDRPLKIMATYDAIPRITNAAKSVGTDIYNRSFLVVDEYHRLLSDYVFRNKAVTGLLEHAPLFKSKTYISATPIDREFLLDELQDMPITRIVWPDSKPLQIRLWEETSPLQTVARMCCNAIARNEESNLHFFINSTTAIGRIARYGKLPYELVKTVCREDEENIEKLGGLPIFAPTGHPRKINFYTSTAFEGCDIYDPQGKIFIVSDRFIKHSMLDVSTSIRQIAGRIRNTEYKEITHIFSKSPYAREVTYEQFKTATEKEVDRAQRWERHRDTADEDLRKSIHTDMRYINPTTQKYDNNIPKLDMMNYRNWAVIYADSNRLIAEHRRNGHEITATARHDIHAYKLETKTNPKIPFRELFEDYARFRANTDTHNMGLVMKRNPLVVESYDKLGADRVRELKHNQTQIKRELLKLAPTDLAYKITKLIKSDIPQGTAIPAKVAKERLQKIYDDLGMKRTAKATDIAEWFDIDKCYRNVDGKNTACIVIIRSRIVVKKEISAE